MELASPKDKYDVSVNIAFKTVLMQERYAKGVVDLRLSKHMNESKFIGMQFEK